VGQQMVAPAFYDYFPNICNRVDMSSPAVQNTLNFILIKHEDAEIFAHKNSYVSHSILLLT